MKVKINLVQQYSYIRLNFSLGLLSLLVLFVVISIIEPIPVSILSSWLVSSSPGMRRCQCIFNFSFSTIIPTSYDLPIIVTTISFSVKYNSHLLPFSVKGKCSRIIETIVNQLNIYLIIILLHLLLLKTLIQNAFVFVV